jgi:NAD(P)-dependent dehydrogenase (short-subunit alcohol dehydrogenase family)
VAQCAPLNIRVNCVVPGITEYVVQLTIKRPQLTSVPSTPFTGDILDDGPAVLGTPIRRKASPQEIADVVIFLASSKASFMQGSVVVADGGHTIT